MKFDEVFRRMQERVREAVAADPVVYLVLDHDVEPGAHEDGRDGRGRRYMRCSPSVMDAVRRDPFEARGQSGPGTLQSLTGIPVYLRQDLADGWPER